LSCVYLEAHTSVVRYHSDGLF